MSQLQDRIAQYRKMANDDPDNELGHFRLGQLLAEAGDHEGAVQSFRRMLELSPQVSKVYQLLAASLLKLNRQDDAVRVLQHGYAVADERGDNVPREDMGRMLVELGKSIPASRRSAAPAPAEGGFPCQRPGCRAGAHAHQLPAPPMNDELGQRIYATVCAACWNEWMRNYSIKVINEMRLDLSTEQGQKVYDDVMKDFLGLDA